MIVMQQIDQVSQDTAKRSIHRTVQTGECVSVCVFVWFLLRGQGQG